MIGKRFATMLGWLALLLATPPPGPGQTPPSPTVDRPADAEKEAEVLNEKIEAAKQADRWDEVIAVTEALLALRTRIEGPKHPETMTVACELASLRKVATLPDDDRRAFLSARRMITEATALENAGKYSESVALCEKALEIDRRVLGEGNVYTAESYYNLAAGLWRQGRNAEAQRYCEKVVSTVRGLLGEDHSFTAESYALLSLILIARGDYDAAGPVCEKLLAIARRLYGEDHISTAHGYNNLAINLNAQGKYAAAQSPFEKALAIRRRLLGEDHFSTAESYNNVASNLMSQGKYAVARPLFEKALAIQRSLRGDDHPETGFAYISLADNLAYPGMHALAQPLYEKALEIERRALRPDAPEIARGASNLAACLRDQAKYAEARPLFEEALSIWLRTLGEEHPKTAAGYFNLGSNLWYQGKYAEAGPLFDRALAIKLRVHGEIHPRVAICYRMLGSNHRSQGEYEAAQPLYEKAVAIGLQTLGEDHQDTAWTISDLAFNLHAQGKYAEACDQWARAARGLEAARLASAFTGLDRASAWSQNNPLLPLAAVLARLGRPAEAFDRLEEDLGRGLLDELFARRDRRLTGTEREELGRRVAELERLDRLFDAPAAKLDEAGRAKRLEELRQERDRARIALGELRAELSRKYGSMAGRVASLAEVQKALPDAAALLAWVDVKGAGPKAHDPHGEHWGLVVRSRGVPVWTRLPGTGEGGRWTSDDDGLPGLVRKSLSHRPRPGSVDAVTTLRRLRAQRLEPMEDAFGTTRDGLPAARDLIVLPSTAMAGIPIESLLKAGDPRTVSYAPSATVLDELRHRPRRDERAGLLAVGDPVFAGAEDSSEPGPLPDHGLLVNVVVPGSNAARHGLKPGDVLLSYNGRRLERADDLVGVPESPQAPPVPVEVWREGRPSHRTLDAGKLGVVLDRRPAAVALEDRWRTDRILTASRSGGDHFAPLPGTRYEVAALSRLFDAARRPARVLLGPEASEPAMDRMVTAGELARFGFLHLATHGVIDEMLPQRSAVILAQTGLPDPLEQALNHRPVYDGRVTMREIQRNWVLDADLVTLSACDTARGRYAEGEGFVGFAQALLMSGARSVCLSLWKVDDTATALLMKRFYENLLGARPGLPGPMPKASALAEAKRWLRGLSRAEVLTLAAELSGDLSRSKGAAAREIVEERAPPGPPARVPTTEPKDDHPYAHPYYWAAFVLVGDPS